MKPTTLSRLIALICFNTAISFATAQTQVSPKYSIDADVNALTSYGDTLIIGGNFNNIGIYTGGGALFTTSSDQPNLSFPKIIGAIYSSTPDGSGGFYIYGNFKKESETTGGYYRIEHILSNFSYEAGFSLPVNSVFRLSDLLYHTGILYIGGQNVEQIAGQNAGDLSAIDVITQQLINWVPAVTSIGGISKLYIAQNTLYIIGRFTDVGGQPRKNIAAIELYTGTVKPWNFESTYAGYSDIKSYKDKVIIGGVFENPDTPTFPSEHACALVDTTTGLLIHYLFTSSGLFGNGINYLYWNAGISSLVINGDTLFTFSSGTFDTRVTAINLAETNHVLWAKYFNMIADVSNMEITNGSLYIAGSAFTDIYLTDSTNDNPANIERQIKGVVKLNTATGDFINWLPDPVGFVVRDVWTMSLAGNNVFVGGTFSHVNGLERTGIAMLKVSTQEVLPFSINLYGQSVRDFKIIDSMLYAAGSYLYVNNIYQPKSVLAFNLRTDSLLPWNPVNLGNALSVEANNQYIFLGGQLTEPSGGADRINLFAIDRQTGMLSSWAPNPNHNVISLHISGDKLYVGGDFTTILNTSRNHLAAFDTANLSLTNWNPNPNSNVNVIKSTDETIWIGGGFYQVDDANCSIFAGIDKLSGVVIHKPIITFIGGTTNAITVKGCYVMFGGGFGLNNMETCNNLAVYDMYNKSLLPSGSFCQNVDDLSGNIKTLASISNDLYFGGSFTKVNGKANATNIERIRFPTGYFDGCGEYISVQNGNWNSPATWETDSIPPNNARVRVRHNVTVTTSVNCFSLYIEPGGHLNVNNGIQVVVGN
jgi:hypothetical protein